MLDPKSEILGALYHQQPDEAVRLAAVAPVLTIWEAAALGRDAAVAQLLDEDPSLLDACAPDGHVPLGLAAFFGRPATVRLLMARGADIHVPSRNVMRVQPLHAAVGARNPECVAAVLEGAPDVNARQQVGYTPLMGAAAGGRDEIVDMLLARGADPTLVADDGKTAADVAREHGHAQLAERLAALRV